MSSANVGTATGSGVSWKTISARIVETVVDGLLPPGNSVAFTISVVNRNNWVIGLPFGRCPKNKGTKV
jgi:hypothetical protein